jgi:hypothetical protein
MTLDNENQRRFLMAVINSCQFPGADIDLAYSVRRAVMHAELAAPTAPADALSNTETTAD